VHGSAPTRVPGLVAACDIRTFPTPAVVRFPQMTMRSQATDV
jgi:hypothetical protein